MNKETANKWYKQAVHDLSLARKNIDIEGYDIASFLAQQAVEKLLKAIFALEGKKVPRTHYIDELGKKLALSEEAIDITIDLTVDYTFARYPDVANRVPYEEYDEEIASEKVEKAEQLFQLLKDRYQILEKNKEELTENIEEDGDENHA